MELKEFIKETLTQIVTGIKEAKGANKDSIIDIAPEGLERRGGDMGAYHDKDNKNLNVNLVYFEVALKQNDNNEKTGGFGVLFANIGGKYGETDKKGNENITSIKFSIPILFR